MTLAEVEAEVLLLAPDDPFHERARREVGDYAMLYLQDNGPLGEEVSIGVGSGGSIQPLPWAVSYLAKVKSVRAATLEAQASSSMAKGAAVTKSSTLPRCDGPAILLLFRWFLRKDQRESLDCLVRELKIDARHMTKEGRSPKVIWLARQWHSWTFILAVIRDGALDVLVKLAPVDAVLRKLGFR